MEQTTVLEVRIGMAMPFNHKNEPSAIIKNAVKGKVWLSKFGLVGDEQADKVKHGGLDKALHQYCSDHYKHWQRVVPLAENLAPGAFGENIVADIHDEANVCLGDCFRIGGAVVQVSQPRQPCWKLNVRINKSDFAKLVQSSGLTGWYYRVLEVGWISSGDSISLIQRPNPDWTIQNVHRAVYLETAKFDHLKELGTIKELSASWKKLILARLENRSIESWSSRFRD